MNPLENVLYISNNNISRVCKMNEISTEFHKVNETRADIELALKEADAKLVMLNDIYKETVKTHVNKAFTFGLDTFLFQNKLIEIELEGLNKMFHAIENRMYCEYYKLYRLIEDYCVKDIGSPEILDGLNLSKKSYPAYRDLEPFKVYSYELTVELKDNVIRMIDALRKYMKKRQQETKAEKRQTRLGLNMHNLLNLQLYADKVMEENIQLFVRYLETFMRHHYQYMKRLLLRSKVMIGIVNEDINLCGASASASPCVSVSDQTDDTASSQVSSDSYVSSLSENDLNCKMGLATRGAAKKRMSTFPNLNESCINTSELKELKQVIGYEKSSNHLQRHFDRVLSHVPQDVNHDADINGSADINGGTDMNWGADIMSGTDMTIMYEEEGDPGTPSIPLPVRTIDV
jgi:hypothetical protein